MKLANAYIVSRLASARETLVKQRDHGKFGVTIDGTYQDETIVTFVRPVVAAELSRRIAEIDADLTALGVSID